MYDSGLFVDFHLNQKQNEIMIIQIRSYMQKHDGATSGSGTAYPSGVPEATLGF